MSLFKRFPTIILFACVIGCGSQVPSDSIESAQSDFDQAQQMVTSGNYAAALPLIENVIGLGSLDPDQYAEAILIRARCYADAGELEKAEADLAEAEQGAPAPALLHLTRGTILLKQGKSAEAKKEFATAKRIDSSIVIPN